MPRSGREPVAPARRARTGRRAELAVADYLVAQGFTLLGANVRVGRLEIDLVARRGTLSVIVEVRTRGPGSFTSALASVSRTKRARLLRAADALWQHRLSKMSDVERVRIDVAAVTFDGRTTRVEYIEGAVVGGDGA